MEITYGLLSKHLFQRQQQHDGWKNFKVTINLFSKKYLPVIIWNKEHSPKYIASWTYAIAKKTAASTLKKSASLLTIYGKIFECLVYDTMFDFFSKNNLLSSNHSWFRPGDSCINQLLSINHETSSAFGMGLEVCGILLDASITGIFLGHSVMDWDLSCVKMVFAVKWIVF